MKRVNLKSPWSLRIAMVCIWLAVLAAAIIVIGPGQMITAYEHISPQGIRDLVNSFGALSIVAFLALCLIRPLFFLPVTPFTIASGFLFGFWQGLLWSLVGTTMSGIIMFFVSRYLFHDFAMKHFSGRLKSIDKAIECRGWTFIMFVRLIPLLPFDVVSYAAGISSIRFRDYLIGTILGEFPAALVLVMLGSSLDEAGSATFYFSLILAVIVLIVPEIVRRWMKMREKELKEQ